MSKPRLGHLLPAHRFFLNPYRDARFTTCPKCGGKTRLRKRPFLVHVDPRNLLVLNMSGPYCGACDLVILHQDKLESVMVMAVHAQMPEVLGNDYLVLGTIERTYWRHREQLKEADIFDYLHDFKDVWVFEPVHYGWVPDPNPKRKKR
jgi:hypothetical protein